MQAKAKKPAKFVSYAKYGYLFILPFFLAYAFFMIYPLINTFILSFFGNGKVPGASTSDFVGLQNYQWLLFGDGSPADAVTQGSSIQKSFWTSLGNTVILWVGNFIVQLVLSLLLAVWFSDVRVKLKGAGFFKVAMYLPNIVTAASVAGLFILLFRGDNYGAVNGTLASWGWIENNLSGWIPFATDPWISRIIVMLIQSWMWFGNTTLLLMSGIFGIDPSIYEAASIDGSSGAHTFFKITMPILKPIFIYVVITSMIGGLQMFDIPFLFNEGTVSDHLKTTAVFIFNEFHSDPVSRNYGFSAAASILLFIITAALGVIIYKFNTDSTAPAKKRRAK